MPHVSSESGRRSNMQGGAAQTYRSPMPRLEPPAVTDALRALEAEQ